MALNLVSSDLIALDSNLDLIKNLEDQLSPSDIAECMGDTSQSFISEDSSGLNLEENIESDQAIGILRRQKSFCRSPSGWSPFKKDVPKWRAPEEMPNPLLDPFEWHRDRESHDPDKVCHEPLRPILLTCKGPEVWYEANMGYVLDCISGNTFSLFLEERFYVKFTDG